MLRSVSHVIAAVVVPLAIYPAVFEAEAAEDFVLEDYFVGHTVACGKFSAINGVKRTFKVDLTGQWDGKTLKLIERFEYDDGVEDTKIWYFTKTAPGRYTGRRSDILGETKIRIRRNKAQFSYKLFLDAGKRENLVRFRDKMVLLHDGTVRNTATVFKYGIPVGRVVVNFASAKQAARLKRP